MGEEHKKSFQAACEKAGMVMTDQHLAHAQNLKAFADAYKLSFSWDAVVQLLKDLAADAPQIIDDFVAIFKT